jgi:hypothetical protein
MKSTSPILEGFRTIFRRPAFGLAEMSWRWSFGASALILLAFTCLEYLKTLPMSELDRFLLETRHPLLVQQALAHIFHGSSVRFLRAGLALALGLAVLWILIAAAARLLTVRALSAYFREECSSRDRRGRSFLSLVGLNFFRITATLAAVVGGFTALLLGGAASPKTDPSPAIAFFVVLGVLLLVWLAWSVLNWFLSLASVFAIIAGEGTFDSIAAAMNLCRDRTGSVFAAGTWFGLAHVVAFLIATSAVAFPLGFAGVLPPAAVIGGVLAVTLIYFALADFLYMGRLAAYVAMIEFPPSSISPEKPRSMTPGGTAALIESMTNSVDRDELILSDLPLQS